MKYNNHTELRLASAMEVTTIMNRGEVLASLEEVIAELKFDFSQAILNKYASFIAEHYKEMLAREEQIMQETLDLKKYMKGETK